MSLTAGALYCCQKIERGEGGKRILTLEPPNVIMAARGKEEEERRGAQAEGGCEELWSRGRSQTVSLRAHLWGTRCTLMAPGTILPAVLYVRFCCLLWMVAAVAAPSAPAMRHARSIFKREAMKL